METIMAVYPRHKVLVDELVSRGVVIGIGPFSDRGNMAFSGPGKLRRSSSGVIPSTWKGS